MSAFEIVLASNRGLGFISCVRDWPPTRVRFFCLQYGRGSGVRIPHHASSKKVRCHRCNAVDNVSPPPHSIHRSFHFSLFLPTTTTLKAKTKYAQVVGVGGIPKQTSRRWKRFESSLRTEAPRFTSLSSFLLFGGV